MKEGGGGVLLTCSSPPPNWNLTNIPLSPGAGLMLMRGLEGRAEALAGTFNAQGVANMLWAYAKIEREPGAGLIRELEGRAEAVSGTF